MRQRRHETETHVRQKRQGKRGTTTRLTGSTVLRHDIKPKKGEISDV